MLMLVDKNRAATVWVTKKLSCLFFIFFIKIAFVTVRQEKKSRNPGWSPTNQTTDQLHGHFWPDDQLVMHMSDYEVVCKGTYGICLQTSSTFLHR